MAVLRKLPHKNIIGSFKGYVDFYYWKGIPVARAWPDKPTLTPALRNTHNNLICGNKMWQQLPFFDRAAYRYYAVQWSQTARDLFLMHYMKYPKPRLLPLFSDVVEESDIITIRFKIVEGELGNVHYAHTTFNRRDHTGKEEWGADKVNGLYSMFRTSIYWMYPQPCDVGIEGDTAYITFPNHEKGLSLFVFLDPSGEASHASGCYRYNHDDNRMVWYNSEGIGIGGRI